MAQPRTISFFSRLWSVLSKLEQHRGWFKTERAGERAPARVSTKTHFRCESTERGRPKRLSAAPERIASEVDRLPYLPPRSSSLHNFQTRVFEFSRLQRRGQSGVSPYQTPSLIHRTKNTAIKYPSGYSRADPASLQPEEPLSSPLSSSRRFMNSACSAAGAPSPPSPLVLWIVNGALRAASATRNRRSTAKILRRNRDDRRVSRNF